MMIFEGDFPPTLSLLSHFKKLTDRALAEAAQAYGDMTVNQMKLIVILGQPLTMKQVAEATLTHPSNVTVLVNGCAKNGWVTRVASDADKRTKFLVLTEAGTQLRKRLIDDLASAVVKTSGIDDALAAKIMAHLDALPSP